MCCRHIIRVSSFIFAFNFIFVNVKCFDDCPQQSFESATIRVCADKCLDQLIVRGCIGPGSLPDRTRTVEVNTKIPRLRRGFIFDLPDLIYFSAFPANISVINPGAFLNLPKLDKVKLVYNNIEEISWGVFSNSSISEVDLRWNLVSYIENEAFSNMPNLKTLNLARNEITLFNKEWFTNSNSLEALLLSYNKIGTIQAFSFDIFPNMTILDLSFNNILDIGPSAFENIKNLQRLDLTRNRLSWIRPDVFKPNSNTVVEELRLPLNRLSFLSTRLLDNGHVKALSLHPNPWQCPCLNRVFKWIYENKSGLKNPGDDHRIKYNSNLPDCAVNPTSPDKCVIGYDDAYLLAQERFLDAVNYSASLWEKPTTARPNFDVIHTAKPFSEDLTPLN